MIANAKLLSFLDYDQPIYLRTDVCNDGAGAMLYHKVNGRDHPVAFMSHTFSGAERRWPTYEQECYGIVRSIIHFDSLLLGHAFIVETDHRNLVLMSASENAKVVRWRTRLQEYSFDVRHIAGVTNDVADALSRLLPTQVAAEVSVSSDKILYVCGNCRRGELFTEDLTAMAATPKFVRGGERPAALPCCSVRRIGQRHTEGTQRVAQDAVESIRRW